MTDRSAVDSNTQADVVKLATFVTTIRLPPMEKNTDRQIIPFFFNYTTGYFPIPFSIFFIPYASKFREKHGSIIQFPLRIVLYGQIFVPGVYTERD